MIHTLTRVVRFIIRFPYVGDSGPVNSASIYHDVTVFRTESDSGARSSGELAGHRFGAGRYQRAVGKKRPMMKFFRLTVRCQRMAAKEFGVFALLDGHASVRQPATIMPPVGY